MPKVSIIIPAYNQAQFLGQAIQSALDQSYRDLEVIVVDDGSTDNTAGVAAAYKTRPNFKYIRQENAGPNAARNHGLKESQGEYLVFLDSDDTLHPQMVEKLARLLNDDSSLGFVYCDDFYIDASGQPAEVAHYVGRSRKVLNGDITQSLIFGGYFPIHSVLVRRSVLEASGSFDPEIDMFEDYELWLRLAAAGHKAQYLDEKLANYRRTGDSRSRDGYQMSASRRQALRKLCRLYPDSIGNAVGVLQENNLELLIANDWLLNEVERLRARAGVADTYANTFNLWENPHLARINAQPPGQVSLQTIVVNDLPSRVIFHHPPATIEYPLPTGAAGRLSFAVTMHPDIWNNIQSGACRFIVKVNNRIEFSTTLDPVHNANDRQWLQFFLDVPGKSYGNHTITFETQGIGSLDYRWAMWRAPVFAWSG